MIIEPILSLLL